MRSDAMEGVGAVILGAGGHALSLHGLLAAKNVKVLGCIAHAAPNDDWPEECPWLGNDSELFYPRMLMVQETASSIERVKYCLSGYKPCYGRNKWK